jgi:predicted 3-demethylubiquinone-9 3-methyltransferase (glyoxalase superfamily)
MPKITPYLWFNDNAEEAAIFYAATFKNSSVQNVVRTSEGGPAMMVMFQVEGQEFMALNGGPRFPFTEAISLYVSCEDQAEVDHLWEALTADGGEESMCGWLKDKYGLSWQIIPTALGELMQGPDLVGASRVMDAMLQMSKIDVAALQTAYDGE